jgi:hypothetical protein
LRTESLEQQGVGTQFVLDLVGQFVEFRAESFVKPDFPLHSSYYTFEDIYRQGYRPKFIARMKNAISGQTTPR